MSSAVRLGLVGAGQMATALARGLLSQGSWTPAQIIASDNSPSQLRALSALGVQTTTSNIEVVKAAQVLLVAVKPHVVVPVLKEIAPHFTDNHLCISIAAGVSLATMQSVLPVGARIIRVMPNTPCLVGSSASAIALGQHARPADSELALKLFDAVGRTTVIEESKLDAVTGLSGSGPAYVFAFIEALADGGVRMGLPRDTAVILAAQTVLGAAKMVLETDKHTGQLKDAVASPGGTTIAGLHKLEQGGFRGCVMNAVEAASQRATELSAAAADQFRHEPKATPGRSKL
jgi:pyrroline-5-carboxylate reductase